MWKDIFALLKTTLTLAKDLERVAKEVESLRQDLTKLTLAVQHWINEVETAKSEFDQKLRLAKQDGLHRHQKLGYQLQIELLKFEKRLPAAPNDNKGKETEE